MGGVVICGGKIVGRQPPKQTAVDKNLQLSWKQSVVVTHEKILPFHPQHLLIHTPNWKIVAVNSFVKGDVAEL